MEAVLEYYTMHLDLLYLFVSKYRALETSQANGANGSYFGINMW